MNTDQAILSTTFQSILFQRPPEYFRNEQLTPPSFFTDLNLNQIVASITAGKEEYDLKPFFYVSLHDVDAVAYRHEVMHDLERGNLLENIKSFARSMREVRSDLALAEKLRDERQKERCFLDAVDIYCDAVTSLVQDLSAAELGSRGFVAFREYISGYSASEPFVSLIKETRKLNADLAAIRYTILIKGGTVEARRYNGEPDYTAEVEATFEKFRQGAVKEHTFQFSDAIEMNPIEAEILTLVTRLYPEVFSTAAQFYAKNKEFQDSTIVRFDREIQFYVAYLEHMARFKKSGLNFCYPQVVSQCKEVYSDQGFDLALAGTLLAGHGAIVCNDFHLNGHERIIVVSGPNQGGKTTFARAFGQLHYLSSLGCPVPGVRAQTFLFDQLLTHFEREENIKDLRGKLQDDLIRVHEIMQHATTNSIVIMNEVFTSTTLSDAVLLSKKIAAKLMEMDVLCVWVTFVDELSSLGEKTVSMVSTVVPENPALRTFRVVRKSADGLAYAMAVAEKHRLTYAMIKARIGR